MGTALLGVALLATAVLALVVLVAYFSGRAQVRMIQSLLAGNHLAHWEYESALWIRFAAAGWAEYRRTGLGPARVIALVGALLALLAAIAARNVWVTALVLGSALVIALLVWLPGYSSARRSYAGAFRHVFIGLSGAYLIPVAGVGRLHQWHGWGLELVDLRLRPGQSAVLHFEVSAAGTSRSEIELPVPDGHEQAAAALVARLRAELLTDGSV